MMQDIDKLVVAMLSASKAAAEKRETPLQYVLEYERMLKVFERRASVEAGKPVKRGATDDASPSVTKSPNTKPPGAASARTA